MRIHYDYPQTLNELKRYFTDMTDILKDIEIVQEIRYGPVLFVGDLHGFIDNLFYAINLAEKNQVNSVVFLGDYIDRGDFQLQTLISILYIYSVSICRKKQIQQPKRPNFINEQILDRYPFGIIALRGNHETYDMNINSGFKENLEEIYGFSNFPKHEINMIYNSLSLIAITSWGTCSIHGGVPYIPENFTYKEFFNQLKLLKTPIHLNLDYNLISNPLEQFCSELLWNDPIDDDSDEVIFDYNIRGPNIYTFNKGALMRFFKELGFKRIVRAHESTRGAYQSLWNNKLIHIFSAYPYFGYSKTPAFYLEFDNGTGKIINHKNEVLKEIK